MNQRHDEPTTLSPAQQAEALRLAARLQEEATHKDDFLAAAEKAGIERRFLEQAVQRISEPRTRSPFELSWGSSLFFVVILTACIAFHPLIVPLLLSLLIALPPCSQGRSWSKAAFLVFGAWLVLDAVFVVYALANGAWGGFQWRSLFLGGSATLALQALVSGAGTELARLAYGLSARLVERRPQSL